MKIEMSGKEGRSKKLFCISGALAALFVVFTVLLKVVDVQAIGPEGTKIGFAAFNKLFMRSAPGLVWYKLAEVLGLVILLVVAVFALIGAVQLFQGKSINAVDYRILLLGAFYVIVFALYIVFDKLPINYRPLILDPAEGLEPSYPSSHTLLAVCVMGTAFLQIDTYLKNRKYNKYAKIACIALAVLTVAARTISGVHWMTDILAALILSAALVVLYAAALDYVESQSSGRGKHEPRHGKH